MKLTQPRTNLPLPIRDLFLTGHISVARKTPPRNQSASTDNDPRHDSLIYTNPEENQSKVLQKNIDEYATIDGTEGVGQLEGTSSKPIYDMNNDLVYETSFVQSTA